MSGKKNKRYVLSAIVFVFLTVCGTIITKNIFKDDNLINISDLPESFVEKYFEEIRKIESDEVKENMLIVISKSKIADNYGAVKVIEAPNNQYILQYDSEKEKETALKKLKEDKRIESAEENEVYTIEEANYNSWGIEKMAIDHGISTANLNVEKMQPVTVAIIDTGCDMSLFNKYYGGKIIETYNVLDKSSSIMIDENGHGTHVAGTIAESTSSNVKILPIKVSRDGKMFYSDIIAAINYIVRYEKADVINMSFGGYAYNEALEQAIESANNINIISVAAAGNDNTSKKHYPSALENTISISSVDSELNKSSFSNYGAEITFAAAGTNIKSIMGKDAQISKRNGNKDGDDDHETISGTSMATPHAASAVAILKSYNKNLNMTDVVDILKENSIDLGEEGWDQYYGNGLISFKDIQFCDGTYCDETGVYKDLNKNISSIEAPKLELTKYNYYSLTNLMGSKVIVYYDNGTSEEIAIEDLPNVEILNYDPMVSVSQTVTIKVGNSITADIEVDHPDNYESGWEYNILSNGKIEITGYKDHDLQIEKLYVPETIDLKQVDSFADDVKFSELGSDFESYTYLYLPSSFTRIGSNSLSETKIKYVYGTSSGIEVGDYAFESSLIKTISVPIIKVGNYAFKDCFELLSVDISGKFLYISASNTTVAETYIGEYAFYNCKKLEKVTSLKNDTVFIKKIGKYAFYNCIVLSQFDLKPNCDIEEYAFYNTFLLSNISLYYSASIGKYAFYGSGITEADFSYDFDIISESAFENCENLRNVSFSGKRIESRAFWNSGVQLISLSNAEYIAEDAFAYAPIISKNGSVELNGPYEVISELGIVENGNKLLVGFTNAQGASNTKITENITEIGNYAFTGNNNLKKITIPENVTKIGEHTFEDCYQLSNVYILGNNVTFGDNTFKRNYEGEIEGEYLNIYAYKDSAVKQALIDKNLNYRHIDPDEIIVTNYEDTYKALSRVDFKTLSVKLIYHEKEDREEVLTPMNFGVVAPISNGVGFLVSYQNENQYDFKFGDSYFVVEAKNAVGYSLTEKVYVTIVKETPEYTVPTGLTADFGQKLSEIILPDGFEWMDGNEIIMDSGEAIYKAKFVPDDTENYEIVKNIDITISINNYKTIIKPEITVENKIYDKTTNIPISNITVSNLEESEYSIESAVSSSVNAGETTATIKLKLSDEKFKDYSFDNGKQTKEFTIDFEILKANMIVTDNSKDVTVKYDGNQHSIEMHLDYETGAVVKYMNENNEYILDDVPQYTEKGTYVIKYKVYIDNNYNEYFGQKTLTIEDEVTYVINKYNVDEANKYISKIMINTELNSFTSSIILSEGYGVDVDYKQINGKKLLYTGGKTRITYNLDLYKEYTNVVVGDINGDGAINSADLLKIRQHLLEINVLSGVYFISSDVNYDDEINSADLFRIRQHLLEIKPIE